MQGFLIGTRRSSWRGIAVSTDVQSVLRESLFRDSLKCRIVLDIPEWSACELVGFFLLLVARLDGDVLFNRKTELVLATRVLCL